MKKRFKIVGLIVLFLGVFLFLPLSSEKYLEDFDETVQIGPYDVDVFIEIDKKGEEMSIRGTALYPRNTLEFDGCLLDIVLNIEAYSTDKYSVESSKNVFEHLYCDRSDVSSDDAFCSKPGLLKSEAGNYSISTQNTLFLKINLAPLDAHTYKLSLTPANDETRSKCDATTQFTHHINYDRKSWFERLL